ncbi:MAG: tetratricopeptide repeat protein [Anaerolineae bacterium]|jgi:tetratricopeptide (TPR) repeat protein|nr:tetratricopeptide repeat protein [Anaerolineae bacterium]
MNRLTKFRLWLGETRLRAIFLLFVLTGLFSLILNSVDAEWVTGVQNLLVLAFVIGAAAILWTRLESFERGRWLGILTPAILALGLGVVFLPQFLPLLIGAALGWIVAGLFLFNPRGPMQYQQAIKHLRKNQYDQAVQVLDELIKQEPADPKHYRFRAEILRIWGKLERAKRDYRKMIELAPESAVAYNGLAEVHLQAGDYPAALTAGQQAYALAPDEWVAAYNLGMIEDRLGDAPNAIEHLQASLNAKVPDSRHRLLIQVYLIRAYLRLGDQAAATQALQALKREQAGLQEWQTILSSEQAETLRAVIQPDVDLAERLIAGSLKLSELELG